MTLSERRILISSGTHVLALEYLKNGGKSGALNLGTGMGHSVMEVISAVKRVSGLNIPFQPDQKRPGDAPVLVADASRARQTIGWTPRFTDIHEIIETAWKWHKEMVNSYIEPPNRAETRLGVIR